MAVLILLIQRFFKILLANRSKNPTEIYTESRDSHKSNSTVRTVTVTDLDRLAPTFPGGTYPTRVYRLRAYCGPK